MAPLPAVKKTEAVQPKETEAPDKAKSRQLASEWKDQIKQAEADPRYKRWHEKAERIVKQYRDERFTTDSAPATNRKLNLYWSNTETLKPAIYSKPPQPIVERRFLDRDPIGRIAAQLLERALRYEMPTCGAHHAFKLCRNDYLTVGVGVPWVRYNPKFGEPISLKPDADIELEDDATNEQEEKTQEAVGDEQQRLESESLCIDYVNWTDFLVLGLPRVWEETDAICKRAFMSRPDLVERFGEKIGNEIPLDHVPGQNDDMRRSTRVEDKRNDKATVYEIWCKSERKVYFVAKEYDYLCQDPVDDPLKLDGFWPCPRPVYSNSTNDTLIPVPDYIEAENQYIQINDLTRRIDILTDACRINGVYDAANKQISRLFTEATEPNLIPVDNWAMFAEKGGLEGQISFVPIEMIAKTIGVLQDILAKQIESLDRLTGVFDIMRGETDPNETKGAQQLKQQNGFGRIGERQEDFARMCRDTIAIMGEIIAEHYDPKTLIEVSGALQDDGLFPDMPDTPPVPAPQPMQPPMGAPGLSPPQAQGPVGPQPIAAPGMPNGMQGIPMPMQPPPPDPMAIKTEMLTKAIELLKNQKLRGFRIDIETDSTIQADINQDKAAVAELLGGVTKFIESSAQVSQMVPEFAPLAAKMLTWAFRRFRVGRDLETSIDEFADAATKMAKDAQKNPRPDPEQIKAQTEQMKAQAEIERQKVENAGEANNASMELEGKKIDLEMRRIELLMKQIEHDHKIHSANMDMAQTTMETVGKANEAMNGDAEDGSGASAASSGQIDNPMIYPKLSLQKVMSAVDKLHDAARKIHEGAQKLHTPREVVRDQQTGKVIGIRPVQ